jgi:hypothetical protein
MCCVCGSLSDVSGETLQYNKPISFCYVVVEKAFDHLQVKYALVILEAKEKYHASFFY